MKHPTPIGPFGLALAALVTAVLSEPAFADDPIQVTSLEGFTEYRMENGLRLLLCPDASVATVTVNVVYGVGSLDEGLGEAGMAHLLEHMLGQETENYRSLIEPLTARGADFNASTWYDRIQFHETLSGDDEGNLDLALHLEAERMDRAILREDALAREMDIITNEFQYIENDLETVLWQRMMSVAYSWHGYRRAVVGNLSEIRGYSIENLRRFYRAHFRPDNAIVVIAGRFRPERALALASRHFGGIIRPDVPLPTVHTVEPPQEGPRRTILRRVTGTPRGGLLYHVPAGLHRDTTTLKVLLDLLTDPDLGLLVHEFVDPGRVVRVSGDAESMRLAHPGVFDLRVEMPEGADGIATLEELAASCESVARRITEPDVAAAKARLLKKHRRELADLRGLAEGLSEWIAAGDWRGFLVERDRLAAVTADDVREVARRYLRDTNRTVGVVVPADSPDVVNVGERPEADSLLADYRGGDEIHAGEPAATSLEELGKRVLRVGIQPGPVVRVLARETRGAMVTVRLRILYGTPEGLLGRGEAARLLPKMLMRGTKDQDARELGRQLDLLQSDVTITGYPGVLNIRIDSDRDHVIEAVRLLGSILRKPAFDKAEFEAMRREHLTDLQAHLDDPTERCFNAARRGLYDFPPGHPHHKPTLEERVEEVRDLTVKDLEELYRDYLGIDHSQAAVVGSVESGDFLVAVGEAFRGWQSHRPWEPLDPPCQVIRSAERRIPTPDKPMAVVGYATLFRMRDDDPDYPAMLLARHVLGSGTTARVSSRLRSTEGLSYHAAVSMQVEPRIECANLFAYAFCGPANADTCLAGLREEVARWIADGISPEELDAARTSWQHELMIRLADDAELASELVTLEEMGRSLEHYRNLLDAMDSLTGEDIRRVLHERLGEAEFLAIVAADPSVPRESPTD